MLKLDQEVQPEICCDEEDCFDFEKLFAKKVMRTEEVIAIRKLMQENKGIHIKYNKKTNLSQTNEKVYTTTIVEHPQYNEGQQNITKRRFSNKYLRLLKIYIIKYVRQLYKDRIASAGHRWGAKNMC